MLTRPGFRLGAIALVLAVCPIVHGQNLIVNGDFSSPVLAGSQDHVLTVNELTGWTVTAGNISLQSAAYATTYTQITQANQTPTGTPANPTQLIDLTGASSSGGMIMQNINSALAGQLYHFSLDNYRYGNFAGQSFRVTITNIVSGVTIATQTFATTQGILQTVGFNFVATNAQIRVTIQDISGGDTNSAWIDNVSVTLVPEAATWGALGGLLSLGLVWRRWRATRNLASHSRPTD